jgi:hypothetical protein
MRRAIQLRMTFALVREGGIEGECRRKHDRGEVESDMMIVPGYDRHEMDQGVGGHETCAGHRRGPVQRPPCPGGQRKAGDQERRANVLDKVRIIGAGLGRSWHTRVPEGTGEQHHGTVEDG